MKQRVVIGKFGIMALMMLITLQVLPAEQIKKITDPKKHVHTIENQGVVLATIKTELHLYYSTDGKYPNVVNLLKYKITVSGAKDIKINGVDLLHKIAGTTKYWSTGTIIASGSSGTWSTGGPIPGYKWNEVYVRIYIKCPAQDTIVDKLLIWNPSASGADSTYWQ